MVCLAIMVSQCVWQLCYHADFPIRLDGCEMKDVGQKLAFCPQVERLSKLIETPVHDMDNKIRFEVINSTANVDKRLVKLFELIENDLLAKIVHSSQSIAPYKASSPHFFSCCYITHSCVLHLSALCCITFVHLNLGAVE